ncbi:uncharacterized protein [Gossypium hirsutum]|uniref:Uncharacterized protein n=1 Tax=Gossypium hirsutum TaxID=3635 RepID=A0ABM3BI86_GOSHI|nr:uncharacterized protein LOC121227905 [Gossypium hirsutum]
MIPQANISMFGHGVATASWPPSVPTAYVCPVQVHHRGSGPSVSTVNWNNPFDASASLHSGMSPNISFNTASMPQAYVATPATVADNTWYPDSGATHHLTNSASSLGEPLAYNGPVSGS